MNNYVINMRASDGSIVKLECHDALPSTASIAREYANMGYPDRYVVFSEKQTGHYDDKHSGTRRGIFMSCILRPSIFPSQAALMSSLATVAAVLALEEHTTENIGIGWVSQLYCDGRLIGNASIEGKLDNFTSYEYIIINFALTLDEKYFPPRITDLIRKVFESENSSISLIIAKNILNKFFPLYSNLKGSSKFMDIYRNKFIMRGTKVKCIIDGKKKSRKVLGINPENCALIVEAQNQVGGIEYISTPANVIIPKKIKLDRK